MLQAGSAISSPAELTTAIKRRPLRQQLAGGCGVSRSSALVNALPKKNHRRASQGMEPLGGARRDGASNRRGPGEPARRSRSPGLSGAQGLGRALRGRVEEPEGVQALPEGLQLPPGMRSTWGGGGGWRCLTGWDCSRSIPQGWLPSKRNAVRSGTDSVASSVS